MPDPDLLKVTVWIMIPLNKIFGSGSGSGSYFSFSHIWTPNYRIVLDSVTDPDQDPQEPRVVGTPGSGSTS